MVKKNPGDGYLPGFRKKAPGGIVIHPGGRPLLASVVRVDAPKAKVKCPDKKIYNQR